MTVRKIGIIMGPFNAQQDEKIYKLKTEEIFFQVKKIAERENYHLFPIKLKETSLSLSEDRINENMSGLSSFFLNCRKKKRKRLEIITGNSSVIIAGLLSGIKLFDMLIILCGTASSLYLSASELIKFCKEEYQKNKILECPVVLGVELGEKVIGKISLKIVEKILKSGNIYALPFGRSCRYDLLEKVVSAAFRKEKFCPLFLEEIAAVYNN